MSDRQSFVDEVIDYRRHFVDVAMLDKFTAYCRKRLVDYARLFEAIFNDAYIVDDPKSRHARETEIDEIANALINDDEYRLNGEEYEVVKYFLDALRGELELKPIKSQLELNIQYSNAHGFVLGVIDYVAFNWRELSKKYRYTSSWVSKIFEMTFKRLPWPVELYALLAAEYAKAREILLAQPEMPK